MELVLHGARLLLDTSLNIKALLQEYKSDFESELEAALKSYKNPSKVLQDSIEYSVLNGGKRLRGVLSLISAEAVLKSPVKIPLAENPALGLALAIEMVHCGSLIHDDLPCMDDDDMRRGKASNHKVYGEAIALLAGDFLISYPVQVLADYSHGYAQNYSQVQSNFISAISSMIFGQAQDLCFSDIEQVSIEQIKTMEAMKTGALIKSSICDAALLAGASPKTLLALNIYAENLGLAFQIIDDVLDAVSTSEELGKTTGKDAQQNKSTFVSEYGVKEASSIAKSLIKEAIIALEDLDIFPDKLKTVAEYVVSRTN